MRHDSVRDTWLASRGYDALRFTNDDVLGSLEGVLLTIREKVLARLGLPPYPQTTTKHIANSGNRGDAPK